MRKSLVFAAALSTLGAVEWATWGGLVDGRADDRSAPPWGAIVQEEFERDNRARELAWQQANVARNEFKRGNRDAALARLSQALETAAKIQGIRKRTVSLVHIATVQAEVGDTQGALKTAAALESLTEQDSTLRTMALDRANAGDLAGARRFADAIQDNSKKTDALVYIEAQERARPSSPARQ